IINGARLVNRGAIRIPKIVDLHLVSLAHSVEWIAIRIWKPQENAGVVTGLRDLPVDAQFEVAELRERIPQQPKAALRAQCAVIHPEAASAGLRPAIERGAIEELDWSARCRDYRLFEHSFRCSSRQSHTGQHRIWRPD